MTASQRRSSLAIFDLDNTLVDRDRFFGEWAEAFVRQRQLDREATLAVLREADEDGSAPRVLFFEKVRARVGLDEPTDRLIDDYWRDQLRRYRCHPETLAGLRNLRQHGYKLGIATNGGAGQIEKIGACGLDDLVDAVCVSQMVGFAKPDPRLFGALADQCGVPLDHAWVVGDRPETDIAGAVAIGVRSVWIRRGKVWGEAGFAPPLVADTAAQAMHLVLTADAVGVVD